MRILIIDNETLHIRELQNLLKDHNITTIKRAELPLKNQAEFDLIILSGSTDNSVVNNPQLYSHEIALVKNTEIPILGICMGFEVIAYSYGATLKELPYKESGVVEVIVTNQDPIFGGLNKFTAQENHRWVVTKLCEPLQELAISRDGVEVLRHRTKQIYGFQFHPEVRVFNNYGDIVLQNILRILIKST